MHNIVLNIQHFNLTTVSRPCQKQPAVTIKPVVHLERATHLGLKVKKITKRHKLNIKRMGGAGQK